VSGEVDVDVLRKAWAWIEDRTGIVRAIGPLARHPVPPGVRWWYVFGSATLFAFLVQVASGVGLSMAYVPSSGQAYESLRFITDGSTLGHILRGIHFWGASAMILLIGLHMIRVFLFAAYKYPREMNWLSGVVLLGLTLGMGFTGQLLRWDQNAIWSVVVGAEQAGRTPVVGHVLAELIIAGKTLGGATLSRFFAFHVFLIPALIFAFLGFHLYLVLRNGISEPPVAGKPVDPKTYREQYQCDLEREGVPFWPWAAWRDMAFGALVIVVIVALAVVVGPPHLGKAPDPTLIDAHPHPDWYLLWYFAVLALLPHGAENVVIILGPLAAGVVLVALPFVFGRGERHPRRRPAAIAAVLLVVVMIGTLWAAGERASWSPDFDAKPLPQAVIGADSGPVARGGRLFFSKACIYCHAIAGHGGHRGPDLTEVGSRLTPDQMTIRILNGGYNMPAYAGVLTKKDVEALVAFLKTRQDH
jgi:ubiquinol-cytochrome c reductase cytochrome b subunit